MNPILDYRDVSLSIAGAQGPLEIVRDVTLAIARGEFVAVLGPSGCGKTTLLNIAAGLKSPGEVTGSVRIDAEPRRPYDSRIGYMVQHDTLLPWRTAAENVALAGRLAKRRVDANELLASVGLGGFGDFYPHELSGGMRKRAQLARLLAQDPSILLMDEPFSALDFQTRVEVYELFLAKWKELNAGVVFVTHDPVEAIALSDRIVVMSPRPARIIEEIPVHLPRPRPVRDLADLPDYRDLHRAVWRAISRK